MSTKKHRRVEIIAFRRRATVVAGDREASSDDYEDTRITLDNPLEGVSPETDEGRRLLEEAAGLLNEHLKKTE